MTAAQWEYFRTKAIRMAGLEGHPMAEYAWTLALKNGHEGGPQEILYHLLDLGLVFSPTPEVIFPKGPLQ